MAFKAKKFWDVKKRAKFAAHEHEQLVCKALYNNQVVPKNIRQEIFEKFNWNFRDSFSAARVKNRCLVTNRAKSVIRQFKMSRIAFRERARAGKLLGVRRSSW